MSVTFQHLQTWVLTAQIHPSAGQAGMAAGTSYVANRLKGVLNEGIVLGCARVTAIGNPSSLRQNSENHQVFHGHFREAGLGDMLFSLLVSQLKKKTYDIRNRKRSSRCHGFILRVYWSL